MNLKETKPLSGIDISSHNVVPGSTTVQKYSKKLELYVISARKQHFHPVFNQSKSLHDTYQLQCIYSNLVKLTRLAINKIFNYKQTPQECCIVNT